MQNADKGDLLEMISERKKQKLFFRESQVWRVLIETVYGLWEMHSMNIMHRDIKSANVFLCRPKKQVKPFGEQENIKTNSSYIS